MIKKTSHRWIDVTGASWDGDGALVLKLCFTTVFITSPSWMVLAQRAPWQMIQCILTASSLLLCTLAHTIEAITLCSPVIAGVQPIEHSLSQLSSSCIATTSKMLLPIALPFRLLRSTSSPVMQKLKNYLAQHQRRMCGTDVIEHYALSSLQQFNWKSNRYTPPCPLWQKINILMVSKTFCTHLLFCVSLVLSCLITCGKIFYEWLHPFVWSWSYLVEDISAALCRNQEV